MDTWALIVGLGIIIGIVASIVQVLDYLQKQREKKREPARKETVTPSPPVPVIPSNLPPRGEFIGREKEKARVWEALSSRWPLTCIDGIGGIGKTALALEVAGECLQVSRDEVPADGIPTFDGFIWTTAKDRELALNDVLDAIARTLDYPGIAQQPLKEKQESVRKLLQSKRYLLIVDNFETVKDDAVRDFLLRLPEPTKALITSREQKLRQAWAVSLKGLEQGEALTLIRSEGRRLGLAAVEQGEEWVLLHLYQATGGAPLAIKWAVGQIKQRGQSLDTVLAALHEAKGDIFEEVFARSWSLLSEEARRILMVMPIFAASASRAAIEAASDVHHYALDEGLGQLVEMWLVEAGEELDAVRRRYSVHPLTRAFARAKLEEDAEFAKRADLRAADYFISVGKRYGGEDLGDRSRYDVLSIERENMLAMIEWCYGANEWDKAKRLLETILTFLGVEGHWQERIKQCSRAVVIADQEKDLDSKGLFLACLSWPLCLQGDYSAASETATQALEIARATANRETLFHALDTLSKIAFETGDYDKAWELRQENIQNDMMSGNQFWLVIDQFELGAIAHRTGRLGEAQQLLENALKLAREIDYQRVTASIMNQLGDMASDRDESEKARRFYQDGLAVASSWRDIWRTAHLKRSQALLEERLGNSVEALALAQEALGLFERLDMRKAVAEVQAMVKRLEEKLAADR